MTEQEKEFLEGINSILYDNTQSFIDYQKRRELSEMILDLNKRLFPQITKKPVKVDFSKSKKHVLFCPENMLFDDSDFDNFKNDHYVEVAND